MQQDKLFLFLEKIDCKLPYDNDLEMQKLISEAEDLGEEGLLGILYELSNPPNGIDIPIHKLKELLNILGQSLNKEYAFLLNMIERKKEGHIINSLSIVDGMHIIKKSGGSIIALNILYSLDIDNCSEIVEIEHNNISQYLGLGV